MEQNNRLCLCCLNRIPAEETMCPRCGYPLTQPNRPEFLPVGFRLSERYTVGMMLSYSGTTAHYIGYDHTGRCRVMIDEFKPEGLCTRQSDGSLLVTEGKEDLFARLHEQFRLTARTVARLRELPILLPIFDIFEQNGTTYTVSEPSDAKTLMQFVKEKGGRLSWEEARHLFIPFLASFKACHASGLFHLGICPETLLVDAKGQLRLTGFDIPAIRCIGSPIDPQFVTGYAAPEQVMRDGRPAAAADVYGITATLFRVLSGNTPPDGAHRDPNEDDLLLSAEVANSLPPYLASVLVDGLRPNPHTRIPTVAELHDRLSTGKAVSLLSQDTTATVHIKKDNGSKSEPKKKQTASLPLIILCSVAILASVTAIIVTLWPKNNQKANETDAVVSAVSAVSDNSDESSASSAVLSAVPDLCGGTYDYYSLPVTNGKRQKGPFAVELGGLRYDDTVPSGMIVAQSPAAGTQLEEGATITVTVSAGKQVSAVPDVTGWKAEQAQLYLEALGFRVTVSEVADSSVPVGAVAGTWPVAGKVPEPGDGNKVTLRINNYEKPTTTTRAIPTKPAEENSGVVELGGTIF